MYIQIERSAPRSRARRWTLAGVLIAGLVGCQTPLPPTSNGAPGAPDLSAAASFSQNFTIDVDPLHGAALERPERQVQTVTVGGQLMINVLFPQVTHDPSTGQTTVTMQLANAGSSLTYLKCQVSGSVPVVTPAWPFNTSVAASGATQTVQLVFNNPTAQDFTINLTFTGTMTAQGALPVGPGSSSGSTSTPTPAPTATSTPAPSTSVASTPTPGTVTAQGGASSTGFAGASASSSYGSLVPSNAIDGNLSTMWASAGYQAPEETLTLDAGSVQPLNSLSVKMQPQTSQAYYQLEVSSDGKTFTPVTGQLRNASWGLEPKAFPAGTSGRYVRLHFFNDKVSPEIRFDVFECELNNQSNSAGATPVPVATPTPQPTATPSSAPVSSTGSYANTYEQYAIGTDPSDFINPMDEGYSYSWLVNANWSIQSVNGSHQYVHSGLSNVANLSFRRYRGSFFGANGVLPQRYYAAEDVTPEQSYTYNPTGDQGTQVYYLDPLHYVEVLIKPTDFQVWECNNAPPFQGAGWSLLNHVPLTTNAGQTRNLGALVDTNAHTLTAYLNGVAQFTVSSSLLTNQTHYLALRGAGNIVAHDNLTIQAR